MKLINRSDPRTGWQYRLQMVYLHVVRADHKNILNGHGADSALGVMEVLLQELLIPLLDNRAFFFAFLRAARMVDRLEVNSVGFNSVDWRLENDLPFLVAGIRSKSAVVENARNEIANSRMKTARIVQKNASIRTDRSLTA